MIRFTYGPVLFVSISIILSSCASSKDSKPISYTMPILRTYEWLVSQSDVVNSESVEEQAILLLGLNSWYWYGACTNSDLVVVEGMMETIVSNLTKHISVCVQHQEDPTFADFMTAFAVIEYGAKDSDRRKAATEDVFTLCRRAEKSHEPGRGMVILCLQRVPSAEALVAKMSSDWSRDREDDESILIHASTALLFGSDSGPSYDDWLKRAKMDDLLKSSPKWVMALLSRDAHFSDHDSSRRDAWATNIIRPLMHRMNTDGSFSFGLSEERLKDKVLSSCFMLILTSPPSVRRGLSPVGSQN